jgi:DNA-binding GntR family transcriptional regulator
VPGDVRDLALQAVLTGTANAGAVDRSLFAALSTDDARQQTAQRVVTALARRDATEARAVMDAYITDPRLRQAAEQTIERAGALPTSSSFIQLVR